MSHLSDESRAILGAAKRGHDAPTGERARLRRALALRVGGGAIAAGAASQAGTAAASTTKTLAAATLTLGAKISGTALVAALALGGAYAALAPVTSSPAPAPSASIVAPARPGPPIVSATVAAVAPSASVVVIEAPKGEVAPRRRVDPPPVARQEEMPSDAPVEDAPPTATPPTKASLADEARALAAAQRALREGDGAAALEALDAEDARDAGGALVDEREAARVFALCQAGRVDEARAAADRFLQRAPRSLLAERVRSTCRDPR